MPKEITSSLSAAIKGGARFEASADLEVGGYFTSITTVPPEGAVTLDTKDGNVNLLFIKASAYPKDDDTGDAQLTYKVGDGAGKSLDAPVLLIGNGAVALLGEDVKKIELTNGSDEDIDVEIVASVEPGEEPGEEPDEEPDEESDEESDEEEA